MLIQVRSMAVLIRFWCIPWTTAQVVGRKFVWVASPKFQKEMYPFGTTAFDSTDDSGKEPSNESLQASYMTNTSQVDVIQWCEGETDSLLFMKADFPEFVDKVIPEAMQVVLEEGDLMIMPPG